MTPDELAELERLANAATPGPWEADDEGTNTIWGRDGGVVVPSIYSTSVCGWDVAFIVAARTAVPALVAKVRELESRNVELAQHHEQMVNQIDVAEQNLSNLEDMVDECAPHYKFDDGTDEDANLVERLEYALRDLKRIPRLARERDEAHAQLAKVTKERDELMSLWQAIAHDVSIADEYRANKGGMRPGPTHELSSAPPSVLAYLRRFAQAALDAAKAVKP